MGCGAGALQLISGLLIALFFVEYLVLKTKKFSVYLIDLVKNPLVIAVFIGVLLSAIPHNQTTTPLAQIIALIGKTASPLALLTLGFFMNRSLSKQSIVLGSIAVVAKLALLPLLVFALSYLVGYSKEFVRISVLISAMPTAVTSFVIAQKYALDEDLCADVIFVSTLVSIVTLPVVIWLLG
jgi:predicted permease